MAIQRRLAVTCVGFFAILAPVVVHAGAAEPRGAEEAAGSPAVDAAVIPPDPDGLGASSLSGEQLVERLGSELRAWRPSDDADAEPPAVVDPIADAFAESIRVSRLAVRIERPAYPVVVNPEVQFFIDRFTGSRREIVNLWVSRSGRYLPMIREVLRERGLPEELAYTAMIESGFNPTAVSRVGAKGMWQFMAGTARNYGLRVDRWVDERLDAEKSTVAAAAYLRDLYAMFGSWALAQAAYNAGEVAVLRAIRKTGSNDFWALARTKYLRRETKEFVPQIHAAMKIGQEPDHFGFDFDVAPPLEFEMVIVPPVTDLRRVAAAAGIRFDRIRALNPVLVRGVTPPGAPYVLRIPAGSRDGILAALTSPAAAPRAIAAYRVSASRERVTSAHGPVHVVRPNDTVVSIAERYGVSVGDLLKWNSLPRPDRIHPGDRLRLADAR